MPPARLIIGPLALSAALGSGCEFTVPARTYISGPTLISIKADLVELGPLNPDRVGVPLPSPIAEPMPGDLFAFEAVVIDADGHRLLGDEIDSLWLQCGPFECSASNFAPLRPTDAPDCDALDELDEPLTLDSVCRIAAGDHHAEFVVPELGPLMVDQRVANYYGIIGWDGNSAEDCAAMLDARDEQLEGCAFVRRPVKIGPSWWMLAYAESIGLTSQIPVWQIPAAVYGQAANRVPNPTFDVFIDNAWAGAYPDTTQFSAALGSTISIESSYDELEQLTQTYFVAALDADSETYWFRPALEFVIEVGYSTGAIHALGDDIYTRPRDWRVDPYAEPGSAQLFITYYDDRYGEGYARLDFEVGQ